MKRFIFLFVGVVIGAVVGLFAWSIYLVVIVVLSMYGPLYNLLHPFLDTPIVQIAFILFPLIGSAVGGWIAHRVSKSK